MTEPRTERTEGPLLPATASAKGLAAFPLGSMQSRAAARSLLDARRAAEGEGTLFVLERIGSGHGQGTGRGCTCRPPEAGTFALCRCRV